MSSKGSFGDGNHLVQQCAQGEAAHEPSYRLDMLAFLGLVRVNQVGTSIVVERRAVERLQASLPARVAFGGRYRLRAVILNMSEAGAKLALDKSADLPGKFVLSVCYKREERHYKAEIRWCKRELLGVELVPMSPTDIAQPHGLARTRRSEDATLDERHLRLFYLVEAFGRAHPKRECAG